MMTPESTSEAQKNATKLKKTLADLKTLLVQHRSKAAHMRATIASTWVSFECTKEELELRLRSNRAAVAPPIGIHGTTRSDSHAELVRSLKAQLTTATRAVNAARAKRDRIRARIRELDSALANELLVAGHGGRANSNVPEQGLFVSGSFHQKEVVKRGSPEISLILKSETDQGALCSTGTVYERFFEGRMAFCPSSGTEADEVRPRGRGELTLVDHSGIARAISADVDDVSHLYQVMCLGDRSSSATFLRIIALRTTLDELKQAVRKMVPYSPSVKGTYFENISYRESAAKLGGARKAQRTVHEQRPRLSGPSYVLYPEHFRRLIDDAIPIRYHESDIQLVYATNVHGTSLHTFYRRAAGKEPILIAVRDTDGRIFGCFACSSWRPVPNSYYGSGESFVFSAVPKFAVYKWSRANHFFQFSGTSFLAIGGGGHFALWFDEDLECGTTARSTTFENPPLTGTSDSEEAVEFKCVVFEAWTFVPHGHNSSNSTL